MSDLRPTLPQLEDIERELVDAAQRLNAFVGSEDAVGRHLHKAAGRLRDIQADIQAARDGLTLEQPTGDLADAQVEAEVEVSDETAEKSTKKAKK